MKRLLGALLVTALVSPVILPAVTLNQVDTFENGTVQGWVEGSSSPNPPTNIASGGPAGPGDNYLQNISSGFGTAGGKMVMMNHDQWTGDYVSNGVSRIEADMVNLGNTDLQMRLALAGPSSQWASVAAVTLPAGSGWTHVTFPLDTAGLIRLSGVGTLEEALSDIGELRILSSSFPAYNGEDIAGTLGVDNIAALPEPATLTLAAAAAVLAACRRRRC